MATVRVAINEAMRALRSVAPGDDPTADELIAGMEAVQNLILDIHEARGPLWDIDIPSRAAAKPWGEAGSAGDSLEYVAGEDQRLRIQANYTLAVTLPNSVSTAGHIDPCDYGFMPGHERPSLGSTGPADGVWWRQPRDGARIEVVGVTQALYFYRADLNQWMPAASLALDSELPFNNRLTSAFEALLAERLTDVVSAAQPTPTLQRRIARGRAAMMSQSGRRHSRRAGEYF